jgi:Raf kinase inhibitor-like YbhB/YbcL family protein
VVFKDEIVMVIEYSTEQGKNGAREISEYAQIIAENIITQRAQHIGIESNVFLPSSHMPVRYTGDGDNLSPPLQWTQGPINTKEWILICEDPDAPREEPFIHWVIYNIPAHITSLPEGVPNEKNPDLGFSPTQGTNSKNTIGYTGPMPPAGHGEHHYHFQIFALDTVLTVGENPSKEELIQAMDTHVIGKGEMMAVYQRK